MKTNKLILLAMGILMFSTTHLLAGDDDGGKKGVRLGWQYSNLSSDGNTDSTNSVNSFYIGLFGEKKLVPLLRLGYGLEYNATGYEANTDLTLVNSQFTRHNLAIPIYLQVKLGPAFVLGGVAPNFSIGNKLKIEGEDFDIPDEVKLSKFDAPVFLGAGFKIAIIRLEARYHIGTMNISKSDDFKIKQGYLQVGAAVAF